MTKRGRIASTSALTAFLVCGVMSAATPAGDLSKYRNFRLGTDLTTIAKQTEMDPEQAQVIHRRPALIQELAWHPQPLGTTSRSESVKEVVFSFYAGELYRIEANYDRYETEGLTTDDIVDSISATYGMAEMVPGQGKAVEGRYGDQEEVIAQWQDPRYCFELIRSSYGPSFRLVGVLKRLDVLAQAAILEATRLDNQEAPQRDAARIASEDEIVRAKLAQARLVNKPNFRP